MKRSAAMILSLLPLLWCAGAHAAGLSVESGVSQEFWRDTRDSSGSQTLLPLKIEGSTEDATIGLLTGFVHSTVDTPGTADRSLTHILDTKLNLSYVIQGKLPIDLLIGMDLNLPTGKTDLSAADLALIRDPEIVTITTFGEGVNLNPTLSLAKEWGPWSAGAGVGYNVRRSYDVSAEAGLTDYDPGDILSLNALLQRECPQGYVGRIFGKFSRFGTDRLRGADFFREGDYRMAGVGISRAGAAWEADVNLRGTFRGKAEILSGGSLVTEPDKSRGDEWSAEASVRHALRKDVSLSASVRGLIVAKNGYSEAASRHNGSKEKIALSVGCDRRFASGMAVGVGLKGFLMTEEAQSVPQFREERTSRGIALAFRIGYN
ncbi:MAG: hypothetical protein PHP88_10415 [bacterium]|nr:hypothetical protein [bacterium]